MFKGKATEKKLKFIILCPEYNFVADKNQNQMIRKTVISLLVIPRKFKVEQGLKY